jgi:drug efflux transport system ATP-binding protein
VSVHDEAPTRAATPDIRLVRLVKRYGSRTALAGIDLAVSGPQILGIVGPDGAGKTTLLRALAGLLEVEADEASVLGFDLRADVTPLKERIGYVPQVFSLYRDLSVQENLNVTARLHGLAADEIEARVGPLLERTGLAPFRERQAGALSGGMKQKLAVVNALLARPALLILDEPTAGVDVLARDEIRAMLVERKHEVLVVLSTSYLDEAAGCDRLVYLDEGRVIASGTPAELRAATPLELYRAWSADPRATARAARQLPWVERARGCGEFARVEVRRDRSPPPGPLIASLRALPGMEEGMVEHAVIDMESALLYLASPAGEGGMR